MVKVVGLRQPLPQSQVPALTPTPTPGASFSPFPPPGLAQNRAQPVVVYHRVAPGGTSFFYGGHSLAGSCMQAHQQALRNQEYRMLAEERAAGDLAQYADSVVRRASCATMGVYIPHMATL